MAEKEFNEILKVLRNYLIGGLVGLLFTIMTTMTIFYFNTKNEIKNHDIRIKNIENQCVKKDNIDIKLNFISNQIQEIKQDIKEIKK
jgi:hypothetical protein